jgi:hypothetical protein
VFDTHSSIYHRCHKIVASFSVKTTTAQLSSASVIWYSCLKKQRWRRLLTILFGISLQILNPSLLHTCPSLYDSPNQAAIISSVFQIPASYLIPGTQIVTEKENWLIFIINYFKLMFYFSRSTFKPVIIATVLLPSWSRHVPKTNICYGRKLILPKCNAPLVSACLIFQHFKR